MRRLAVFSAYFIIIIINIIIIYSLKIGAGQQGEYAALTTAHNIK